MFSLGKESLDETYEHFRTCTHSFCWRIWIRLLSTEHVTLWSFWRLMCLVDNATNWAQLKEPEICLQASHGEKISVKHLNSSFRTTSLHVIEQARLGLHYIVISFRKHKQWGSRTDQESGLVWFQESSYKLLSSYIILDVKSEYSLFFLPLSSSISSDGLSELGPERASNMQNSRFSVFSCPFSTSTSPHYSH